MRGWIVWYTLTLSAACAAGEIPASLGWHELPNTRLRAVCPPPAQYPEIQGAEGCAAVTEDWSGAAFDAVSNRMYITGGGHGGYAGNEFYMLDVNALTLTRINEPSTPVRDGCQFNGIYADGRPVSRHTYQHLEFLPDVNRVFMVGGSRWFCGFFIDDAWTFDPAANQWAPRSMANGPNLGFGLSLARDPHSGLIYAHDDFDLYSYNPTSDTWSLRAQNASGPGDYKSGVIDPLRRRYYYYADDNRTLFWYDISNGTGTKRRDHGLRVHGRLCLGLGLRARARSPGCMAGRKHGVSAAPGHARVHRGDVSQRSECGGQRHLQSFSLLADQWRVRDLQRRRRQLLRAALDAIGHNFFQRLRELSGLTLIRADAKG